MKRISQAKRRALIAANHATWCARWGITGDGVTDDSAGLQRAADGSWRLTPFLPGRYAVSKTITIAARGRLVVLRDLALPSTKCEGPILLICLEGTEVES